MMNIISNKNFNAILGNNVSFMCKSEDGKDSFSKFSNMYHHSSSDGSEFWMMTDNKNKSFYYANKNRVVFQYIYTWRYVYVRFRDSNGDFVMKYDRFRNYDRVNITEKEKDKWLHKFKNVVKM